MNKELWFASTNKGKIEDLRALLSPDVILKTPYDLPEGQLFDVVEDEDTFEGNSLKKAKELYFLVHQPVLADDSGLVIEKLNGFPGVHSNRWYLNQAFNWKEVNELLLKKMQDHNLTTEEDRKATFITVMTYFNGSNIEQFRGELHGYIAKNLRGENGFGYAPIFIEAGTTKTQGEMTNLERQTSSHRAKALNKFIEWWRKQ